MDSVGVDAVLIDGIGWIDLGNGVWRKTYGLEEQAVAQFPGRFAYTGKIAIGSPTLEEEFSSVSNNPNQRALRGMAGGGPAGSTGPSGRIFRNELGLVNDQPALRALYDRYFALAAEHSLPVFTSASGEPELVVPFAERFPTVTFVLDHCGISHQEAQENGWGRELLRKLVPLADVPNIAIKWSHAQRLSEERYPYRDIARGLRSVMDAYGADRIMWGSDYTQSRWPSHHGVPAHSYAENLRYLYDSDLFTDDEKDWLFGRTIRTLLGWSQEEPR
jgi:hypothetical protein